MSKKYKDNWYHFEEDLENYPDAWCYVVFSKRGPGKTYSCLKYYAQNNIPILYVKRTNKDVEFITADKSLSNGMSSNPYAPLNIDLGWNIRGQILGDGYGMFGECEPEDPDSKDKPRMITPKAICFSLNAMKALKGFNMRDVKAMVFDEFIPQPGEIVKHAEGEMTLSMYMTVNRAREKLGQPSLKMILFANAESISTPITNELEITNDIVELCLSGETHKYIESRGILLHHITNEECPIQEEELQGIAKAMQGTAWYEKNFEGKFNVDMSNIGKLPLKGMKGYIKITYKRKPIYIYLRDLDGMFYACKSPTKVIWEYDFEKENDQKNFYYNHYSDLRLACMEDRFRFQNYTMYDVIINFKNFFKI